MLVADRIAELLQRQGAEHVVGFPENRLIDAASRIGMRPIITRTERVAVNIADGFARASNGERLLPCVTQYGPGAEAAFGAVAQAYGDRSPILLVPTEFAVDEQDTAPVRVEEAYRPVTTFAATLNSAERGPDVFRRALNAVRMVRSGPALVAVANDVMNGDAGDADWSVEPARPRPSPASPDDVAEAARRLAGAARPVILAGQGVLYAGATDELVALAELTGTPVATTLNGKSAFPENHPLALGTAARTRPATVDQFLEGADLILGVGTSFTRSLYITPMPAGATLGQIVHDPRDLATGYDVEFACVGDARIVLSQLMDELGGTPHDRAASAHGEVAAVRDAFTEEWMPHLSRDAAPAQPVPDRVGADAGRRSHAHRRHPRRRPPPRPDRAVLRDDRAARLPGLGQVDPARHGPRPGDGRAAGAARLARGQHHGRRRLRHDRHGLRDRRARPHPDPHDRDEQRPDGRLRRVDAGRGRPV